MNICTRYVGTIGTRTVKMSHGEVCYEDENCPSCDVCEMYINLSHALDEGALYIGNQLQLLTVAEVDVVNGNGSSWEEGSVNDLKANIIARLCLMAGFDDMMQSKADPSRSG